VKRRALFGSESVGQFVGANGVIPQEKTKIPVRDGLKRVNRLRSRRRVDFPESEITTSFAGALLAPANMVVNPLKNKIF
jgi:hypothetical protein